MPTLKNIEPCKILYQNFLLFDIYYHTSQLKYNKHTLKITSFKLPSIRVTIVLS